MKTALYSLVFCALLPLLASKLYAEQKYSDPYKRPEVIREIIRLRDMLLDGKYSQCAVECRRAEKKYPDILVWRFGEMLVPQARMLELHDYSLEKEYLDAWQRVMDLYQALGKKKQLSIYDHLCLGGGYGIYGLHQARARRYRRAFAIGVDAIQEHGKAKEIDPECNDIYLGYGIYHYYRGVASKRLKWLPFFADDKNRGLDELDRARKGLFSGPLADVASLYLYKDEGKWEVGLEVTRKLRRQYPDGKLAAQHEGLFLLMLQKYEAALKEFDYVLKSDQYNASVHYYRGLTLFRMNRVDEAEDECLLCIKLGASPEYKAYSYYTLGEISKARGDRKTAIKYWQEALKADPQNSEAADELKKAGGEKK